MAQPALDRPDGAMSVRALAWLGLDSFGRGETTRPALQHEGLFTGHAPDGGQQPHRPPAHGASMIGVADAHSGSSGIQSGYSRTNKDHQSSKQFVVYAVLPKRFREASEREHS
jgi:hypothetical protein